MVTLNRAYKFLLLVENVTSTNQISRDKVRDQVSAIRTYDTYYQLNLSRL